MKGISSQSLNLSKISSSTSEVSAYAELFKGLMQGMGWQDITGEVVELDSQQHIQITSFKTRLDAYTSDKSLKTVKDLLVSVEEQLVQLRHQRSHLLQLERHYTQEIVEKKHEDSSSIWSQVFYKGVENLRYFFDSTPSQLATRYQKIAEQYQQQITNLSAFKKELHKEMRQLSVVIEDDSQSSTHSIVEFQASVQNCQQQRQLLGSYNPLEVVNTVFPGAMKLYPNLAQDADNPFVRTLYDGSFIVTWNTVASSTDNSVISAIRINANNILPETFNVSDSLTNYSNPTVAIFDNLQSIFTWDSGNIGSKNIYASCYSADMTPGTPFMVNSVSSGNDAYPVVATFENFFVIAWAQNSTSSQPLIKAKFYQASIDYATGSILCNNSLALTGETPLATVQNYMSNVSVDVTALRDSQSNEGQYYFTWASGEGDVYVRPFSVQGMPLRSEIKLDNIYPVPPKSKPLIEAKSDGNLLVAWRENFGTDADIFAQLVSTQGSGKSFGFPVQPSFEIVTSFADENYPAIGAFPGGNFVVVWSISLKSNNPQDCIDFENEYCKSGLYARFFSTDETPVKNWYCLNNLTSQVVDSHIDTFSDGNFVLVTTNNQSVLSYAIYQNQPPKWQLSTFSEDEFTGSTLSLQLLNRLVSYDDSGYIKDPEGGIVTCFGEINSSSVFGRTNAMPLSSKNFKLDESACLLSSSSKLSKGSTTISLQTYDPEQKEARASLMLNVNNRLTTQDIVLISFFSVIGTILIVAATGGWCWKNAKNKEEERGKREGRERDQKNEQYRFIQSPFANEVHAWLNLSYERFESGDGEKFYKLINTVLQEIRLSDQIPIIDKHSSPHPAPDEKGDITLDDLFYRDKDNIHKVRFYLYALAVSKSIYSNTALLPRTVESKTESKNENNKISLHFDQEEGSASIPYKQEAEAIVEKTVEDLKSGIEIEESKSEIEESTERKVKWKPGYLNGHESTWIRECRSSLINSSYETFRGQQRSSLIAAHNQGKQSLERYSLFHLGGGTEWSTPTPPPREGEELQNIPTQ